MELPGGKRRLRGTARFRSWNAVGRRSAQEERAAAQARVQNGSRHALFAPNESSGGGTFANHVRPANQYYRRFRRTYSDDHRSDYLPVRVVTRDGRDNEPLGA